MQYRRAQISINLTNWHVTPPHEVLEEARRLAAARGLVVTGSEMVGVIPYRALLEAGKFYLRRQGASCGIPVGDILETAVFSMGLGDVQPFDIEKKVLGLPARKPAALVGMKVADLWTRCRGTRPHPAAVRSPPWPARWARRWRRWSAASPITKRTTPRRRNYCGKRPKRRRRSRTACCAAVDDDTDAFNAYLQALRLPSETPEQQQLRAEKMQAGLRFAVDVPYQTAKLSFEAMGLARSMAEHGLAASMTDAAVGCEIAFAGVRGGIWNVLTNLPQITDRQYVADMQRQFAKLLAEARKVLQETSASVDGKLAERAGIKGLK